MNESKASQAAFLAFTALVVIASAAGLAFLWPAAQDAARAQSNQLVGEARTANQAEANINFQLASWLDPDNQAAYLGLARTNLAAGRPADALQALDRAQQGSEAQILRLRVLMELNRYDEAATLADNLNQNSPDTAVLKAEAYVLAGRSADAKALSAAVTSSEALRRLGRLEPGTLPLAAELYASGLPNSSSALLMKLPTSYERNYLLATIYFHRRTKADLTAASSFITEAIALNPSSIEGRQLQTEINQALSSSAEAPQPTGFSQKLKDGTF